VLVVVECVVGVAVVDEVVGFVCGGFFFEEVLVVVIVFGVVVGVVGECV